MKAKLIITDKGIYRVPLKLAERIKAEADERDGDADMSDLIESVEKNGRYLGEVFATIRQK